MLPKFTCGQVGDSLLSIVQWANSVCQFAECSPYDGQCKCPPGWGGIDCLTPRMCIALSLTPRTLTEVWLRIECDSLANGEHRLPRAPGEQCHCKDGWGGINCNGSSPAL